METIKKEKLAQSDSRLEDYNKVRERLEKLIPALEDYTGKIINATFFKKYFLEENKNWKGEHYTEFRFSEPRYNFQKDRIAKIIYLHKEWDLEVPATDRETVLESAKVTLENIRGWIKTEEERRANIEKCNEEAIADDIIAVFEKHGRPIIWREVLDEYRVKYPKE